MALEYLVILTVGDKLRPRIMAGDVPAEPEELSR